MKLTRCDICKEDVNGPCESAEQALTDGCINPSEIKRGLDPKVAKRVAKQQEGIHALSSGPGSYTN